MAFMRPPALRLSAVYLTSYKTFIFSFNFNCQNERMRVNILFECSLPLLPNTDTKEKYTSIFQCVYNKHFKINKNKFIQKISIINLSTITKSILYLCYIPVLMH